MTGLSDIWLVQAGAVQSVPSSVTLSQLLTNGFGVAYIGAVPTSTN